MEQYHTDFSAPRISACVCLFVTVCNSVTAYVVQSDMEVKLFRQPLLLQLW